MLLFKGIGFTRMSNEERIVSTLRTSLPGDGLYFFPSIDLRGNPTAEERRCAGFHGQLRLENEMDNVAGKWARITGASSGFGIEFASLLAERKANLILAARRTEPMEKLAEQLRQRHRVNVVVEGVDLSVPGAGAELKARLDKQSIVVDVLVNNAGFGLFGEFVSQPIEQVLAMLRLNMLAVTELTHLFASDMVKRRTGHILLVASSLGYEATPGYAACGASKGYVLLLGEALHAELKPHGVNVTVLSPGPASTTFGEVAGQKNTAVIRLLMMDPKPVARTGIEAMLRHRSSLIAGILNKLIVFSFRFIPRLMRCNSLFAGHII